MLDAKQTKREENKYGITLGEHIFETPLRLDKVITVQITRLCVGILKKRA